jgi:GMP reductase
MFTEKALNYDDIYLVPSFSKLETRSDAETSVKFGKNTFRLPVIPSNMETVINEAWAEWLSENNYFYVMHRFNGVTVPLVEKANNFNWKTISISTGVNRDSLEDLCYMKMSGLRIDYITIDVAHGHHIKVKTRIEEIKNIFTKAFVIAGNVTTAEAVADLTEWGADAIKVGIGPGKACTTKLQTGFHVPMFTAVKNCAKEARVPIIADGGIKHYGDVAKALVAGATMTMAGSLFASCSDSPAPTVNGRKVYFGSASFSAKKENKHIEGTLLELEQGVALDQRLSEIKQALQSSISYAGGSALNCLKYTSYVTLK